MKKQLSKKNTKSSHFTFSKSKRILQRNLIKLSLICFVLFNQSSFAQFVTVWKTDNAGASASNQITIPTSFLYTYSYTVNWGDASFNTYTVNTPPTHTYASPGTYTVSITGTFPSIRFNNSGDKLKILTINNWGTGIWQSFGSGFYGCANLQGTFTAAPILAPSTSLSFMFTGCGAFNTNISNWDVSSVTDMNNMFYGASTFNQPIGTWNVGAVTDMGSMFRGATAFNQPIGNWNVGAVTNMNLMFCNATAFNQPIGNWDVGAVTIMGSMFFGASVFNQPIGTWNVGAVTYMGSMFCSTTAFNQPIDTWNVGAVTDMNNMFRSATAFNQPIGTWNVGAVTNMGGMFSYATAFNQPIDTWNVSAVTSMGGMFLNATAFNKPIGTWNVGAVTYMGSMFYGAPAFNQPIDTWNVGAVTNMNAMFYNATAFNQPIGTWNVGAVTNMSNMFFGVTLSTANYHNLLIGWNALNLKPSINFHGGFSKYCSAAAIAARSNMTSNDLWAIIDGGISSPPTISVNSGAICSGQSFTMVPSGASTYTYSNGTDVVTPTTDVTYSVSGTDANGCVSSTDAVSSITVNALPTITVTSGAICTGQSFTMVPSGATTYTYSNGSSIVTPTADAAYSVTGTDANGCVSATDALSSVTVNICTPAAGLNFDGANDYASTTINCDNTIMPDITWEAWVKPTNQGNTNWQMILSSEDGGWDRFIATQNGLFSMGCGNGPFQPVAPDWNQWQHIAVVYSGTQLTFYKNGVPYVYAGVVDTLTQNSMLAPFMIGNVSHFGFPYTGNIDEVRVWNTARTQCEINTYMNCEIPAIAAGLVANYHFNQGFDAANNTETTLMDASGNSNTGTLVNFTLTGTTSNWVAPGGVVSNYTTTLILPTITVNSGTICTGQSFTLVPTGADSYTYSSGSDVVNPIIDATYTVTGTNTLTTCSAILESTITVNALPTITVNSGAICTGNSFTMVPTGASTYTYSNGSDIVSPTADATYSVSGTDVNGCVSSIDAISSVTVNALPTISVNSGSICVGQSFTMVPSGADVYVYSNGSDVVNPTTDATYTVTGTNTLTTCSAIVESTVTVNALPTISVNSGSICAGQSFTMVPSGADVYVYSSGSDVVNPTVDATYTVTGTNTLTACAATIESTVTVNALPTLTATTSNTLLCTGETATLSVTGSAISYTWNTTENTTDIAVTPTVAITYTVDGTDVNGCTNTTTITQDVNACTGIVSLNGNTTSINVYPNPNNGLFSVDLNTTSQVSIINALGQVILTETIEAGKHNFDIQNQSTGVYFVKVIQQDKQHIIKLIKK